MNGNPISSTAISVQMAYQYYIENKSNLSKIVYIMIWNSVCWKFYSFNWGTNKKQNC